MSNPLQNFFFGLLALGALSACGSSGASDCTKGQLLSECRAEAADKNAEAERAAEAQRFTDDAMAALELAADYANVEETPVGNLPAGTATYNGYGGFIAGAGKIEDVTTDAELVSRLTLQADFGNDTIGGSFHTFRSRDGSPVTGSVQIQNGVISDNAITSNVAGALNIDGVPTFILGDLEGFFLGIDGQGVSGLTTGTAGTDDFSGIFVAER